MRGASRRHQSGRGAALLEVLVAMALIVVAVLPMGNALVAALRSIAAAGDYLRAAALAQQATEQAKSEAAADFAAFAASGATEGRARGYNVCRRVTATPAGWDGTARVEIAVTRAPCAAVWSGQAPAAATPARLDFLVAREGV